MGSVPMPELDILTACLESSLYMRFLKDGLEAILQERYTEGTALFSIIRSCLPPEHIHIIAIIDAFLEENANYQRIERELQEVVARFAEVKAAQKLRAAALATPLSLLINTLELLDKRQMARESSIQQTPQSCLKCLLYSASPIQERSGTRLKRRSDALGVSRHADGGNRSCPVQTARGRLFSAILWPQQ